MLIEETLGISASFRGNKVFLKGDDKKIKTAEKLIKDLRDLAASGYNLKPEDIRYAIRAISEGSGTSLKDLFVNNIPVSSKRRFIIPKTETQKKYLDGIKENDIVVGIGPAGTGKTYLAVAFAVASLKNNEITKIVLTRPAVEAGESLGFLPGDLKEKIDPYLRPLYDALDDMIPAEKLRGYIEKRVIEIAPLAYMRGRTLNNAFVILDEAQNSSAMQMKMFLTRLGPNSRAIVTGDVTQIDLPSKQSSGLVQIQEVLRDVEGIAFVYFDKQDVVRHRLVKDIIDA